MRRYFFILMMCFVVFSSITVAHAETKTVSFCFNAWAPFAFEDDGINKGITIDIVDKAVSQMGLKAEFIHLPWKRCLQSVRDGQIDAVIDASRRKEFLQGPASAALFTNTVWVHKDFTAQHLFDLADFENKTVGLVNGYDYPPEYTSIKGLKIDLSVDDLIALKKLSARRVDFVVGDITNTFAAMRKNTLNICPLSPTPSANKLYVSFNARKTKLHQDFDHTLMGLLEDGTVNEIYLNYIEQDYTTILKSVETVLED